MSGSVDAFASTTPFTAAQVVAIIRYCGYPAYSRFGWVFEGDYTTLILRLQGMAAEEVSVVVGTFLSVLPALESAIDGAGANLDTDQASVWRHNSSEVHDRTALYNQKRRELCNFIGVAPGRGLRQAGSVVRS